jgi:molybdenum cofactor cytidylyltransferase
MTRLGAVLLAAGASRRFGDANKLTAEIGGRPLIRVTAEQMIGAGIAEIVVVTGWDRQSVEAALQGLELRFAYNPNWSGGMGSSIAVGIAELSAELDGALIVPGDMPLLTSALIAELVAKFSDDDTRPIVFPATKSGEQRNPVLWPRRCFPSLASLSGPEGGKRLLQELGESCLAVPVRDEHEFLDVDEVGDLKRAAKPDKSR